MDLDPFGNAPIIVPPQQAQASPDVDPFGNRAIAAPRPTAQDNIIDAQGTSPDEYSETQKIGDQVGVPPAIVGLDKKKFQEQIDRRNALDVVDKNPVIKQWIEDNATNAKVAHDDLPALDRLHNAVQAFSIRNVLSKLDPISMFQRTGVYKQAEGDAINAAVAAWGTDELGARDIKKLDDLGMLTPGPGGELLSAAAKGWDFEERLFRSALFGGQEGWKSFIANVTGQRDLAGMWGGEYIPTHGIVDFVPPKPALQWAWMRARHPGPVLHEGELFSPAPKLGDASRPSPPEPESTTIDLGRGEYEEVKPFGQKTEGSVEPWVPPKNDSVMQAVREGEPPRIGTDWTSDQIHMAQHESDAETFAKAFELAQQTKLRERSPEALESLLRIALGNRSIYIPSEAVERFYKNAEPTPDDEILGWTNNAEQKVATSLSLGTDLQIPMAQALAHMDPSIFEAIKDQVRFHEVSVNNEEAKVLKDVEPEDYPVDTRAPEAPVQYLQNEAPWLFEPKPAEHKLTPTYGLQEFGSVQPMMHEVNVRSGADLGRIMAILGPSRYENMSQMAYVTVKEMLQNSFDAIKDMTGPNKGGKIDISMDPKTRTISVHDDGVGMGPDILGDKFWEIAGTKKESGQSSGGFGISKLLWQHNNTGLRVYTLNNGVFSSVKTNGAEVHESFLNPAKPLKMTSRIATIDDGKMFPKGHGTRIEVDIPAEYKNTDGELQPIHFEDYIGYHNAVLKSPLFHDIEVKFNKQLVEIGKNFPKDNFTQFANVKFGWGDVRIYMSQKPHANDWDNNMHILSNAVWQFSTRLPLNPLDPWGKMVPKEFYIDVKPKVKPEELGYPFDMNRQGFSKPAEKDFALVANYISKIFQAADIATSSRNFGDIAYLEKGPGGVRETERRKLEPPMPQMETPATRITEGDRVTVEDGKLIVNGKEIPGLDPEHLKETQINLDELRVPQEEIDPNRVILHDNLEVDRPVPRDKDILGSIMGVIDLGFQIKELQQKIDATKNPNRKLDLTYELDSLMSMRDDLKKKKESAGRVSLVEAARQQFGKRFDNYAYYIGNVFMQLRDFVAEALNYDELKKEGIGISFDKKYLGVSIRLPFSGSFINAAIADAKIMEHGNPKTVARRVGFDMVGTMVHELAHHKVRSHNAEFPDEMQQIQVYLDEASLYNSNIYDVNRAKREMAEFMEKNYDIFTWLAQQIKSGSPQSRGKRLKGAESSGGGRGLPPDAGQDGVAGSEPIARPSDEGGADGTGTDGDRPERGPGGEGVGGDELSDVEQDLFDTPAGNAQRESEERAAVETDLTKAVRRERRALYLDPLFKDPKSAGMDAVQFGRYSRKIAQADQEAYEKALEKAKKLVKKRLTPEWERDREQIKGEVTSDLKSLPMVVADRYLRLGELPTGEFVPKQKLSEEDVARLGGVGLDRYTLKRDGVHPDDLAPFLQFESGRALVDALNTFEQGRKNWDADKGPNAYFNHLVDIETDDRMERRYGSLQSNILDEARELVTTASHLDILIDEMKQLAQMAGLPFERGTLPAHVEDQFQKMQASQVSYETFRKGAEKQAKIAEKALLKSGYREAFQAKQRQYINVLNAKEARAFEKTRATMERNFKRLVRQEKRTGIDQDYFDNVRKILRDIGFAKFESQEPLKSLDQLISESSGQAAVAHWLVNPNGKRPGMAYENLTVEEALALRDSIRSLLTAGRDARKVDSIHGSAELDNLAFDIERSLSRFGQKPSAKFQSLPQRLNSFYNFVSAPLILVERMLDYSDKFDPNGPLSRFLDRPLRQSYVRELELTEQVVGKLRKLEPFAKTANEMIDNKVIRNRREKQWEPMNRHNLRMVMLHFGSVSGREKIMRDYEIDLEKDLFDMIHSQATKDDVDWVNGMHDIFNFLWNEAAPMFRRYHGVEPDRVVPSPYSIIKPKEGGGWIEWNMPGGYAPYFHDKSMSNIEGDLLMKGDLFDREYIPAVPARSYTLPRTGYKGWMDMDGTLMKAKIQQMIHDIAFREAVRNAQKIISHPQIMTSFKKYWGDAYAAQLIPWLRSIANVHAYDDAFAQDFARGMRNIRQAMMATLINYNPGTALKHGMSAGMMSAAQRPTMISGFVGLGHAGVKIGVRGMAKAAGELLKTKKATMSPAERAAAMALARPGTIEFILNSSALMRNRMAQYPDTIRGAYERASEAGLMQGWRNISALNDQMGRFMVSFGDFLSTSMEWHMTYKDALARTGEHNDAVFEADRAVARAHGSTFPGDKPAILRLGNDFKGELAKTGMAFYQFFNHMLNNIFQWAWDVQARSTRGAGSEPGANWNSILQRLFILGFGLTLVEGLAEPALSENKDRGLGHWLLLSFLRSYGGMLPGIREITNGVAGGYEPSTGMFGNFLNLLWNAGKDVAKPSRNAIVHFFTLLGMMGVGSAQVGRTVQGGVHQIEGTERPRTLEEYRALYRKGYIRRRR